MEKQFPEDLTKVLGAVSDEYLSKYEEQNGTDKTRILEALILAKSMLSSMAKLIALSGVEEDKANMMGKILASYASKSVGMTADAYKFDFSEEETKELTNAAERFVDNLEAVAKSKTGGLH
jgi:hypothetical protein